MNVFIRGSLLFLSFVSISLSYVYAQQDQSGTASSAGGFTKVGAAGGQFLKIGVGARATGMGQAFTALANDLSAIYYNPAGIVQLEGIAAEFSYTQMFAGFSHNWVAASLPISESFRAAVSFTSSTSGDIPVTTIFQDRGTGAFYQVSDFALGASLAGRLTDQFSFGLTVKYVQHSILSSSASGFAFDVGTIYQTGIKGLSLGLSLSNLGGTQQFAGGDLVKTIKIENGGNTSLSEASLVTQSFGLPIIFRAGLSADILSFFDDQTPEENKTADHQLVGAMDFLTLSDVPEQFNIGLEYVWNNFLCLRGGYIAGQSQLGITGGIGLRYIGGGFDGRIDYSINPTATLGLVNRITVAMRLL